MAVPINRVYQTVLNILNKEQRGFITPDEFNTIANQAQIEIFEKYFYDQNRFELTNRMSAGDYNDLMRNIEEKITFFDETSTLQASSPGFFQYPANFYRLGIVSVGGVFADEVSHKDILYIERGPLTASTSKQPKYTRHEGGISLYPTTTATINMVYVREPSTPNWVGGIVNSNIVPVTTDTNYQDFELHSSEEPELVAKILAYSGVLVRDQEAAQAGAIASQSIKQDEA